MQVSPPTSLARHCAQLAIAAFVIAWHGTLARSDVPAITGNVRVDALLSQMTLAEKLTLIHDAREDPRAYQGQAGYVGGVKRLGIPGLRLADGPPGVLTRQRSQAETATMGVAASFDVKLAQLNGMLIGREARALGIDVSLQPFVNIDRDLAQRRAYNTFGEDPLLTSLMGAALIRGIQSQHVMAMAKHFVAFDTAVRLHVTPRQLQYWSVVKGGWITADGTRTISVGASSRDLRLDRSIGCNRRGCS